MVAVIYCAIFCFGNAFLSVALMTEGQKQVLTDMMCGAAHFVDISCDLQSLLVWDIIWMMIMVSTLLILALFQNKSALLFKIT